MKFRITVERHSVVTLQHEIDAPEDVQVTSDAELLALVDEAFAKGWSRTSKLVIRDEMHPHTDQDRVLDFQELPSRVG